MAETLKGRLIEHLADLGDQDLDELLARRYRRITGFGRFKG
jgi:acetyl-CoA carboxylase alpha subunit